MSPTVGDQTQWTRADTSLGLQADQPASRPARAQLAENRQAGHSGSQLGFAAEFALIDDDPDASQIRRITFVPFLPDGQCLLIEGPDGPALPAGAVRSEEDYLLDTVLRVPLETAGFRYQRFRSFGLAGDMRGAAGRR